MGCTKVSQGCKHCYAEVFHARLTAMRYAKYAEPFRVVKPWPDHLDIPLRRKKPTTWFVNSMSDLFHEDLPDEYIAAVFGVMAACPQHTFQVLTKRPKRALEWFGWIGTSAHSLDASIMLAAADTGQLSGKSLEKVLAAALVAGTWPLPNVWLGVSVEDQTTADERIPLLLQCPAAVRFVSYEPALGPVDFGLWLTNESQCGVCGYLWGEAQHEDAVCPDCGGRAFDVECSSFGPEQEIEPPFDWVIVGGESGPGARWCYEHWIQDTIRQCRESGVACFVKQLGSNPQRYSDYYDNGVPLSRFYDIRDKKGGDMSEWPEDLRVREYPLR